MIQEKKNAGYEGEADQHKNCRKKFSNAHMIRNGYIYTDRVLIIKASYYMKKGKLYGPRRALQLPLIFIVMCFKYVRIGKAKLFVIMKWRITLWGYN